MRVAAAGRITARVRRVRTCFARPMHMIPVCLDILVDVRMHRLARGFAVETGFQRPDGEVLTSLPFQACPLNHVPKMRNDTHLRPELAVLVEIDPPGIAPPFGEYFKLLSHGMKSPHPA